MVPISLDVLNCLDSVGMLATQFRILERQIILESPLFALKYSFSNWRTSTAGIIKMEVEFHL